MRRAFYFIGVTTILITFGFLFAGFKTKLVTENTVATSPNIIIIFMDDMGYGDLECYGGFPYHTPSINKLAGSQGMRFTNFYAAQAVCSASRAALLTGCSKSNSWMGVSGAFMPDSKIALNPEEETIAEILKAKGYKTGMSRQMAFRTDATLSSIATGL